MKISAKISAVASLALPFVALAQQDIPPPVTDISGFIGLICTAVNWMFTFLIVLTILFIIIAAFIYLTAGGDPEKARNATSWLTYAAVAVGVAVLAKGIPLIVGSFLGAEFTGC